MLDSNDDEAMEKEGEEKEEKEKQLGEEEKPEEQYCTLFRLWLDDELLLSLPSPSSLLPYPHPVGYNKDDSALPSSATCGGTVVAQPPPAVLLLLDCVFTMDQQQLETFGHPLLLRHDNCCDYASSTTTRQHDDAVDDPPFVVVFGARDDLLRARLCVPRPRHSSQ
ncbi:hypothetical protein niasHT_014633 [Heterodera trifolii]|uniref:Uncharacterized protein n=1 Tax=Heterodera trifolii TaxID=157864 RepID=A0ABD2LKH1_9BILA